MQLRIAVLGGSYDPTTNDHVLAVMALRREFDLVIVSPCGPREDKPWTASTPMWLRSEMVHAALGSIPRVIVDHHDLEHGVFTRTHEFVTRYRERYSEGGTIDVAVFIAVGTDLLKGGANGESVIHRVWQDGPRHYHEMRFAILKRVGYELADGDRPTHPDNVDIDIGGTGLSSTDVRKAVHEGRPFQHMVPERVAQCIARTGLYRDAPPETGYADVPVDVTRLAWVYDPANPHAVAIAERFQPFVTETVDPTAILAITGDGGMIDAIHHHRERRVPFIGINAGHLGMLMNPPEITDDPQEFLRRLRAFTFRQLRVSVEHRDGHGHRLAVNDAWVKCLNGQSAWVDVEVIDPPGAERRSIRRFIGDGMLVSTTLGSTAYARILGGQRMGVLDTRMQLVAMACGTPFDPEPEMVPPDCTIRLTPVGGAKRALHGFVDGQTVGEILSMTITMSGTAFARLAFADPALFERRRRELPHRQR